MKQHAAAHIQNGTDEVYKNDLIIILLFKFCQQMSIFLLINMGALSPEGAKSQIKNEVVKWYPSLC